KPTKRPIPINSAQLVQYAAITASVLGVLALVGLLWVARSVVVSVFLGLFLAAGLEPMVVRLQRFGLRRGLAVTRLLAVLLFTGTLLLVLALRPAIDLVGELADSGPKAVQQLSSQHNPIGRLLNRPDVHQGLQSFLQKLPSVLTSSVGKILGAVGTFAAVV